MIPSAENRWYATGKRKSAVARVWLTPGTGKVFIRKWRKLTPSEDLQISYTDPKTGEEVEEVAIFSDSIPEGKKGVPYTAKAGKLPFRYTPSEEYFGREILRLVIQQPFQVTSLEGQFDVYANVRGGGLSGQANAIRHGIAKALLAYELSNLGDAPVEPVEVTEEGEEVVEAAPALPIRGLLKKEGLLTRDARVKERKKYGQPGARKRFQYSKR